MKRHRSPLFARELGQVRRTLVAATLLLTAGVVFVYVSFDPANRYRILAEPMMLRSLLLPGALLAGGMIAWISFVAEMRSGTWDGWLLLPRPRLRMIACKAAVGLLGGVFTLLVPVAVLWSIMRAFGNLGGPLIGWDELLFESAFTQAAIVSMTSYLAAANAAILAREGKMMFLAPLLIPLIATWRFFVGSQWQKEPPPSVMNAAWLFVVVAMLLLLLLTISRHGRRVSALQTSLRAALSMPVTGIGLTIVVVLGFDIGMRLVQEREVTSFMTIERADIGEDGSISTENDALAMYSLRTSDAWEEPRAGRLRTPIQNLDTLQIFRERGRDLLTVFDQETGAHLGCLGPGGLGACEPARAFDTQPSVLWLMDSAAIVTETAVYGLDGEGAVTPLWSGGRVSQAGEMGELIALVAGEDLLAVRPGGEDGELQIEVVCRGAASPGRTLNSAVIVDHPITMDTSEDAPAAKPFSAARARLDADPAHEELIVCRDGEVTERVLVDVEQYPVDPPRFGRGDAEAMVIGPVLNLATASVRSYGEEEPWPLRSWVSLIVTTVVTLLGGAFAAVKRRAFPWWVLPGIALGPTYVIAGLLLLERRSRWAGLVGGNR